MDQNVVALPAREEVEEKNTWDLSILFPDQTSWEQEYNTLVEAIPSIQEFRGKLSVSIDNLASTLERFYRLGEQIETLLVFARLRSDEDTSHAENFGAAQRARSLFSRFLAAGSFLKPEILSIEPSVIDRWLESAELQSYRRALKDILRLRPHTLGDKEEELLASARDVFAGSSRIFSQLTNADMLFDAVEVNGKPSPLSHGTYSLYLKHQERTVREQAYQKYYREFHDHRNTLAATLAASVEKDCLLAKLRRYPSALDRSLFADKVDRSVYENLLSTVTNNLQPLYEYYEFRCSLSGLDSLRIYDTYVPLVADAEFKHSYEEAVDATLESLTPLGSEYCTVLRKGLLEDRWVDRFENRGKMSGAYSSGPYRGNPYILLNYNDTDIRDMATLTHEAGHSMHSYYSNTTQTFQDAEYSIFVAEVASTVNEQLLMHHLKQRYQSDPRKLAFLLNSQIDDIKATFFRQVMFAEFEKLSHELVERHEALTLDAGRKIYHSLLEKYFGPALAIEDIDSLEYLRIPHFYHAFYVYKYATGLAAAIELSQPLIAGDTAAQERYLRFLKSGKSKPPLELLKDAGVDLRAPKPLEGTCRLFQKLLVEFTELLKNLG